MANPDVAFGFVATPLLRARPYSVGVTNASIIYINDVVALEASGNMITAAAASALIIGSSLGYHAISTAVAHAPVADAVDQEFHAQDDAGATLTQTAIGQIADHVATAGSTYTKLSGHEINAGTQASTIGGFQLLDVVDAPDNVVGANAIWRLLGVETLWNVTTGV
mgnify:FL=1